MRNCGEDMNEEFFRNRLASLRSDKKVSAREMSLSLGQNPGYVNSIEMGKTFPSMAGFFYICDYFGITPQEFFDGDVLCPNETTKLVKILGGLDKEYIDIFIKLAEGIAKRGSGEVSVTSPTVKTTANSSEDELKNEHDEINELYFKMLSTCEPAEAMTNIGRMYLDGIEVKKDFREAMRWLNMAAAKGSKEAEVLLLHFSDLKSDIPPI